MRVTEIRSEADFAALKPAWNALMREVRANTIFTTWEWAWAWWSAYGAPGDLRILAAVDDRGVVRGIAPLRRQIVRRYGQSIEALTFVGDGSNDSDYLDVVAARAEEEAVMQAFSAYWPTAIQRGAVLMLNEVPETSRTLAVLRASSDAGKFLWCEEDAPCATAHLPATWDAYLAELRPRFRTKVRSVLRNLEGRAEVQFGFCETREDVECMLPVLFDLHARRWAQEGKPGVFGWDRKREFYRVLCPLLLERGWLRFSWLKWNRRALACQFGFEYDGAYFHLQEGYEPESEHWNVGIGLRAWTIREFIAHGVREYDFLGGVGRHKTDWGAETKTSKRIVAAARSYKNTIFCRGPVWESAIRESVKKIAPKPLLELRDARVQQQRGTTARSPVTSLHKAAATCYFHGGLAAVARPLRDRYRVSRNGSPWHFSWKRRMEPSARVFCYHRVNNENDSFFPAISTELFEQHMRYISRHYRVVSVGEMLDRLDAGSPEPVLAITFDDGYEDNYRNAFPILRRYGVPATIFLATGPIDSREPLWFEQLAFAIKNTEREFLDLELEIPRRFWIRTVEERIQSNGKLFGLLRAMNESARRECLDGIFQCLGRQRARSNGMLTWEQIREMNAHGVDFGGHTVTHPFLSKTPQEQASWEVTECKRRIEAETQQAVIAFAYPNGREEDIGEKTKTLIRNAGYRGALSTIWGVNRPSTDRMELRRSGPWEHNAAMFAYKLDWYELVE